MTYSIKLTLEELQLLTSLAADQLFRREFIDPKMPGYKANPADIGTAKGLIARMRLEQDRGRTGTGKPMIKAVV